VKTPWVEEDRAGQDSNLVHIQWLISLSVKIDTDSFHLHREVSKTRAELLQAAKLKLFSR